MALKCPIGGVGAPLPILDSYTSSYKHIFIWNTSKLHFLYPSNLVEDEYVKKIFQYFSVKKKIYFFSVGAPMPIFEPYISSYSHIFGQQVALFVSNKTSRIYECIKKNVEKNLPIFYREEKTYFLALELQCQFLSLKSALTTTFLDKMPQNVFFFIQLGQFNDIHKKYVQIPTSWW